MAMPKERGTTSKDVIFPESFSVVVESVIGTVDLSDVGDFPTAIHAAFSLIADYTTETAKDNSLGSGRFSFPDPYGGVVSVVVEA
jgi:hypothetical protein